MHYRLKHVIEYGGLRIFAAVLSLLPYRAALGVGWIGAWLAFHVFRFRVGEMERRILQVFGDRISDPKVRRIAWQSCRNMVFTGVEMTRIRKMNQAWVESASDCAAALEVMRKHGATGRGAVLAVAHMGNWEIAALIAHFRGIPIFSIAGRQRNPLTDRFINDLRTAHGIECLTRGSGTMKDVLRKLKQGGVLAILPDVRVPVEGVQVHFLGGGANLGTGMALFARHADVPIFPGIVTRQGWTRYVLRLCEPVWPDKTLDKDADVRRITAAVMKPLEDAIRADPGQWFWFNRRWIHDPLEIKR